MPLQKPAMVDSVCAPAGDAERSFSPWVSNRRLVDELLCVTTQCRPFGEHSVQVVEPADNLIIEDHFVRTFIETYYTLYGPKKLA